MENGELVCLMTIHVDDLKIAGRPDVVKHVLTTLQQEFGELKILWNDFTNCGVHHEQDTKTKEITLNQIAFANNLRPIAHPELSTAKNEDKATADLTQLYQSLLGATAYLAHTRVDALVFISALQRHNTTPLVIHVKRLNKLVRWLQRHPKKLAYRRLLTGGGGHPETGGRAQGKSVPTHLRIISDAAFKREGDSGHCLRGALFVRAPGTTDSSFQLSGPVHVLEWVCKGQRHVARSTFAAELLSAGDALDQGLLLVQQMHEMLVGPTSASNARERRLSGGFIVPLVLYVDAMSVYAAITATFVKTPAEKSLLCHVQFIRELLNHGTLRALGWLDTRDMISDGLTKGVVDRVALHLLMEGKLSFQHTVKIWSRKVGSSSPVSPEGSPEEAGDAGDYLFISHCGSIHGAASLPVDTMPSDSNKMPAPRTPPKAPWRPSLQLQPAAPPPPATIPIGTANAPRESLLIAKASPEGHASLEAIAKARVPLPLPLTHFAASASSAVPKPPPTGRGHPESSAAASAVDADDELDEPWHITTPKPQMPSYVQSALTEATMQAQFEAYYKGDSYMGTYLRQGFGHSECNRSWTADCLWRYAHQAIEAFFPLPRNDSWDRWIPFASLVEFVQTMGQATQHPRAAFWWPCNKLAFYKSLEVAFERLVPGVAFCVKSRKPSPQLLTKPSTERGHLEGTRLLHDDVEVYHGTALPDALNIMIEGFRPTTGAGSPALFDTWRAQVPGVYTAHTLSGALTYPIHSNTLPHAQDSNGVNCGFIPSMHPSAPVRVVFRCLARASHRLWHRKANKWNAQSIYPYNALHITHVYFVGISYDLVHTKFPFTALVPLQRCIRTAFLARPRATPEPPAATGRGHPEGREPGAPAAITLAIRRPLSERRGFTPSEMKKLFESPSFMPNMPHGISGAWTASLISDLLMPDIDPEFGLHVKVERNRPWTGIGEWRHVTVDEVSSDCTHLLKKGFEHSSLIRSWLSTQEGAGETMCETGFRSTPRVRLGTLKVDSIEELMELLGPVAAAEAPTLLAQDKFTGLVSITCRFNYKLAERTTEGGHPEGGVSSGTGISQVLAAHLTPKCRDGWEAATAPMAPYEAGGTRSAERAAASDASASASTAQSASSLKRARKKAAAATAAPGPPGDPNQVLAKYVEHTNRALREYAKYSRVALASYYKTNQDYYGEYIGMWPTVLLRSSVKIDQRWTLQLGPGLQAMRPEAHVPGAVAQAASRAETAAAAVTMAGRLQQRGAAVTAARRNTGWGHPEGGAASSSSTAAVDTSYTPTLDDAR